jgi:hypothetical protein
MTLNLDLINATNVQDSVSAVNSTYIGSTQSFVSVDKNGTVVIARSYNYGNKFRNTNAFQNGNINIAQTKRKQKGGDVRERLRIKLEQRENQ